MATDWKFFDARCKVGLNVKQAPGKNSPWSVQELLGDMDQCGVHEALVLDCLSAEASPKDGNPRILKQLEGHPRVHPVWVGLPAGTDETPDPAGMLRQMRQHKVAALYLLPNQYRYTLDDWCVDDLLEPMNEAGVPVFISYDEVGPSSYGTDQTHWDSVVELCRRWPKLPVIVSEYRIRRTQRILYKAFDACPNLKLEVSAYWLHRGIEYITRRWGAQRLIFGSNWPTHGIGLTLPTVACAEIDEQDKRRIAGDNLRELIRWCDPPKPQVDLKPPADELVQWGRTGLKPPGIKLYDNHGHAGGTSGHYHVPDGDADSLIHEMDRFGVEQVCVFSLSGVFSDEMYGNDRTLEYIRKYPGRFVGFTMLNLHRGPDFIRRELDRTQKLGMRGIKLIPSYQGYPEEGPNVDVACQWAHDHKQLILNHNWGGAQQMRRLVDTYPNACFFTGHTTLAYADVIRQYKNLFVCSCPVLEPRIVETVVASIGADRFLFGSDLTDLPISWGIGPILMARISEPDKRKILGDNLRELLTRYSLPS
ncbi:MAG: amidohydrolase family protein [Phycisphaerales bacterium]|nr:amidohydrolase family protein [Phycisphaerales bacterium]